MQGGGPDSRPLSGLDFAANLLGVASVEVLADSLQAKARLPDGRFEAHEFGQDEHSTASAGALIIGIAGIREIPNERLRRTVGCAAALVDPAGNIRGHDGHPSIGATSWSISQLLLGLLQRYPLVSASRRPLIRLLDQLISIQHTSGSWPLRIGNEPDLLFSFYPALALAKTYSVGLCRDHQVRAALQRTAHGIERLLASTNPSIELRIMAIHAQECLFRLLADKAGQLALQDQRDHLLAEAMSTSGRLQLQDKPVVSYQQPMWHSIIWRPLLYLCVRGWAPPMAPVNALLAGELLFGYSSELCAWLGPSSGVRRRTGVSWASALALRAVVALAEDLQREGTSIDEFTRRVQVLSEESFEYDVVISFGGPDRALAEQISNRLKSSGLRVFYDRDHQHALLGEDLAAYLHSTYFTKSRFAIVLLSPAFLASKWAGNWEWRAVLARMQQQREGYVLPYIVEDVTVPGLSPSIGYVRAAEFSVDQFCNLVYRKVMARTADEDGDDLKFRMP